MRKRCGTFRIGHYVIVLGYRALNSSAPLLHCSIVRFTALSFTTLLISVCSITIRYDIKSSSSIEASRKSCSMHFACFSAVRGNTLMIATPFVDAGLPTVRTTFQFTDFGTVTSHWVVTFVLLRLRGLLRLYVSAQSEKLRLATAT
jgi:hypothetical protein